jgi:myosin heavy subunit
VAENKVILEFVGDVSGLKPAIDTLSQLGNLSEEQVEAFKKANEQFKKTSQTANEADKSVSKLATSFKQVSGAVAGKAIVEPLNDMKKAADNTTASVNNLGKSSQSLKSRLREIKNELAGLDEGSKRFQELSREAGVLEDRIGDVNARVRRLASDTQGLDALLGAAQGIAGAFSIAQGAAALFGKENEDLQKALLRVQASLSVLNGLQAVAATLNKDSAFSVIALGKAKQLYTWATTGATAATNAFRAALIATGVGAAVAGLGLIIAYWDEINEGIVKALKYLGLYEETQNKVTSNSKEYNEQLKETKKLEEDLNNIRQTSKTSEDKIRSLNLEISLLKFLGASQDEIKKKTIELKQAELEQSFNKLKYIDLLIKERGETSALIGLKEKEKQQYLSLTNQLKTLNAEKDNSIKKNEELISSLLRLTGLEKTQIQNVAERAAVIYTEALKRKLEQQRPDFAKQLGELLSTKVDVPPLKIPLELEKSVQFQQFVKNELPQILTQATQEAFNATFAILSNARQAQFDEENQLLEQRRERELANKNLTESQKASIEKRFEQQRAAIRQRQFQSEKQAAIAQALINGALAVTNILATTPKADFGAATFALLALNTIQTAAQVAVISSQKAPKFAKGGWIDGKPHSQGGTLIEAEKDEFVVRKSAATKNRSFLEAFNNTGNVAKALDLIGYMPQIRDNDMIVMENKTNIDYSKLGRAVAREMAKLPQSELEVNYRGLLTSINSQQSLIEWQKRKYN